MGDWKMRGSEARSDGNARTVVHPLCAFVVQSVCKAVQKIDLELFCGEGARGGMDRGVRV